MINGLVAYTKTNPVQKGVGRRDKSVLYDNLPKIVHKKSALYASMMRIFCSSFRRNSSPKTAVGTLKGKSLDEEQGKNDRHPRGFRSFLPCSLSKLLPFKVSLAV